MRNLCAHLTPEEVAHKKTQGLAYTLPYCYRKRKQLRLTILLRGSKNFQSDGFGDY